MTIFKTKHQYYLQLEDDIRSALTTTGPYFDKLMKRYTLNLLKQVFVSFL